jgi:UDP-N-acetylmuramoylalanine--D-glutamate ligase
MELKGKKILVVGLGKSGLAAALFLRRRGAQVTVSDVRSAEALAKEIPALLEEGIAVEAGGHGLADLPPSGSDRGEPRRALEYA